MVKSNPSVPRAMSGNLVLSFLYKGKWTEMQIYTDCCLVVNDLVRAMKGTKLEEQV